MIEQSVQVVRCEDESVWVRLGGVSGCSRCDSGKGCGAGVFAKLLQRKPVLLELKRQDISVKPGQMVSLSFPEQVYLKLVLDYYGWPLLMALVGAFAGYRLGLWLQFGPVLLDVSTLVVGLLAGGIVLRLKKSQKNQEKVVNSLSMAVYHPSATPTMCGNVVKESGQR